MQKITQEQASRDAATLGYTAPASGRYRPVLPTPAKNRALKLEGEDVFIKNGDTEVGSSEGFVFSPAAEADGLELEESVPHCDSSPQNSMGRRLFLSHFSTGEEMAFISSCKDMLAVSI